ncbi:MAG: PHP domain-containing protein [Candidatus Cloacimonetes bacterium]|nr:PHP domain-containing protein [Candidatus Cloacimonadota bacterium]
MRNFRADLHIHSVLSPCGGLEMSPSALIKRLKECGVEWFAITDHNSMANCPAYEYAAQQAGLFFSWGVEIQTVEEIHLLAYFDDSAMAQAFDSELYLSLMAIENDPDFFGDQVIIDEKENILKMESRALINSSLWDLTTAVDVVQAFGGLAVPAHIDATVNSIISQLGFLPAFPDFPVLGITAKLDIQRYLLENPQLAGKAFLRASDAHYLDDLSQAFAAVIYLEEPSISELILAAKRQAGRHIVQ